MKKSGQEMKDLIRKLKMGACIGTFDRKFKDCTSVCMPMVRQKCIQKKRENKSQTPTQTNLISPFIVFLERMQEHFDLIYDELRDKATWYCLRRKKSESSVCFIGLGKTGKMFINIGDDERVIDKLTSENVDGIVKDILDQFDANK